MMDVMKHLAVTHKWKRQPLGWSDFIQTLSSLNIPLSMTPNNHACMEIHPLKNNSEASLNYSTPTQTRSFALPSDWSESPQAAYHQP